jgi:regulator of replication initiation timing
VDKIQNMDSKIEMIYTDLDEVKHQMEQNVFQMTTQIVNLEELHEKSKDLEQSTETFKKDSSRIKKIFYCDKDTKLKLVVIGIGTIIIGGLIALIILSGLDNKY